MSDLHQYEISYNYRDDETHFRSKKTLVWAYTVQEAVFQLTLEWTQYRITLVITEAGPVKKACTCPSGTHFHVCPECQDVEACHLQLYGFGGCSRPERSDSAEPCRKCMGKKPHRHYCCICLNEYDCTWKEVHSTCGPHDSRDVPCRNHSAAEIMTFFRNQGLPPEKV